MSAKLNKGQHEAQNLQDIGPCYQLVDTDKKEWWAKLKNGLWNGMSCCIKTRFYKPWQEWYSEYDGTTYTYTNTHRGIKVSVWGNVCMN